MEMINHLLENSIDSKRFIDMVTSPSLPQAPTRKAALAALEAAQTGESRMQRRARQRAEHKAAIRAKKATAVA